MVVIVWVVEFLLELFVAEWWGRSWCWSQVLRLRGTCSTVSSGVSPGLSSWRMRLSSRKLRAVTKSCQLDAEWFLAEGFPFGGANGSSDLTSRMAPGAVPPGPGGPGQAFGISEE